MSQFGTCTQRNDGRLSPLRLVSDAVLVFATAIGVLAQGYDPRFEYRLIGDHYEGLLARAVGGHVQLLSARVAADVAPDTPMAAPPVWESQVALRFFLPEQKNVAVTVRQLRSRSTYYVLDHVTKSWAVGRMNEYAWTTAPVLRELSSVRPGDLGAVVNLGGVGDSRHEWALPVALFDDKFDGRVKTYRFTLKTDGRAEVLARIYVGSRQLFERPKNWEATGSPFTVQWTTAASAAEGWYRLVLSGQFDDGSPVDKEVTFYHKPALAPGGSRVP